MSYEIGWGQLRVCRKFEKLVEDHLAPLPSLYTVPKGDPTGIPVHRLSWHVQTVRERRFHWLHDGHGSSSSSAATSRLTEE